MRSIFILILAVLMSGFLPPRRCAAAPPPSWTLELSIDRSSTIPGEVNFLRPAVTNTSTYDFGKWYEFRYIATDANGKEIVLHPSWSADPYPPRFATLNPGETYKIWISLNDCNVADPDAEPGVYKIRCEMPLERPSEGVPIPPPLTSNVVTLVLEKPNIVAEKAFERTYSYRYTETFRERKSYFKTIVHHTPAGNRLYCATFTRKDSSVSSGWYRISENVDKSAFDMEVSGTGDINVWYREKDGRYYHFIQLDVIPDPYDITTRYVKQPLDVPEGHKPQFKVTEGRVTLDYVPISQPPEGKENHQPEDGGEDHHNGAGQGVTGETPPAAQSFPIHLIIIAAVIIIGILAAVLIIRSQKRHGS